MVREDRDNDPIRLALGERTLVFLLVVSASFTSVVCVAQPPPQTSFPIAPEPVGSGARALGQSAFIAVADDATAASWNPAGLINLERPEASVVGMWKSIDNEYSNEFDSADLSWSASEINFMSGALPIPVGNRDMVISVNYHQVYDLGLNFDIGDPFGGVKGSSEGAISAYSVAGALSMPSLPQIAFGMSFNWYTRGLFNDYVREVESEWVEPSQRITETLDNLRGYNFTFGVLCNVYERQENLLTLGFVCHTPFTAELDQELETDDTPDGSYNLEIDFPLSLGAGVNYRFSDRLSTAFDVQWTNWSEFTETYEGNLSESPVGQDTMALRLGGEYLTFLEGTGQSVLAYRGGVFYEPRPAWDGTLPVYGLSLGLGWTVKEQLSLDFAYQYRWGEGDFTWDTFEFNQRIEEHWFIGSVVVYFR